MNARRKIAKEPAILAVDDTPDNLFLIEAILGEGDYQLSCVDSGMAAIEAIEKSPPSLILLDVMMPDIDGYEVTRRIRQNQNLPHIPILLITAQEDAQVLEGADGIIHKPFDVEVLQEQVDSLLADSLLAAESALCKV